MKWKSAPRFKKQTFFFYFIVSAWAHELNRKVFTKVKSRAFMIKVIKCFSAIMERWMDKLWSNFLKCVVPCFMLSAVPLKTNNATVPMLGFMTVGTIFHANSYPEALQCRHSRASRIFKTRTDIIIYRRRFCFHVLGHVFTLQCKSIHDCAHSPAAHLPPLFRSCATLTNSHNSEALSLDELE